MFMSTDAVLTFAFTSMLLFGIGLTVYARLKWGQPRRRRRHA
jgi:hypothetical protein